MRNLIINTSKYCHIISKEDIVFCKSENGSVRIVLHDNKVLNLRMSLIEISSKLNEPCFISPHRSFIINMKQIKSLHTHPKSYIETSGDFIVPVSRSRLKHVRRLIDSTQGAYSAMSKV